MQSERPLVSAIIPTYNYARFLDTAIASVLAQTYPLRECIVVDDGSQDETAQVLAAYGDQIRVIRTENQGLSNARNTGVHHARGRLLAFLDADDWWEPTKLERQVDFLAGHPHLGAVGCGVAVADATGAVERRNPGHPCPIERAERLRKIALRQVWLMGSGSGVLVRRDVYDRIGGFAPNLRGAEDWDLWLRIAAEFPFDNVPDVLTTIRKHQTGTFRDPRRMADGQWAVYRRAVTAWPDVLTLSVRARMRALIMSDMGIEYLAAGRIAAAIGCHMAAVARWPFDRRRWLQFAMLARSIAGRA